MRIVASETHPTVAYAVRELAMFLGCAVAEADGGGHTVRLEVQPEQAQAMVIDHGAAETRLAGRTPVDLLHAVYRFLEHLGFLFTVRGPVAPDVPASWPAPFLLAEEPVIPARGIRQHINFPMDISSYALPEALAYIRNLARMKLNTLTFHVYDSQGWYHYEHEGASVGEDPSVTFFYSEHHFVSSDPLVRAVTPNRKTFCIPEIEALYRSPDQRIRQMEWLRRVIACARECGMTVHLSLEPTVPGRGKPAERAEEPLRAWCARRTAAAVRALLAQYPEVDGIELLTPENAQYPEAPSTFAEAWALLATEIGLAEPIPAIPFAVEDEALSTRHLLAAAYGLAVAAEALRLLADDPLLAGKARACGAYVTDRATWCLLPPIFRAVVPEEITITMLPAHAARRVARNLHEAGLDAALLSRSRIYTWCEFDGLMYLQQNEAEGLSQCLTLARSAGGRPAALVANHWRSAENEVAISYLAEATYTGRMPAEVYAHWLAALFGAPAAPALAEALTALDEANAFAVEHLFNLGFCYLGCWKNSPRMGWVRRWTPENLATYRAALGAVADRITAALPHVTRTAGLERCRLLLNRLGASQIHCDVVAHYLAMRALVAEVEPGALAPAAQATFRCHAAEAAALIGRYTAHSARYLPDRGAEGALTSYEHVMRGFLRKFLGEYAGEVTMGPEELLAGPPSPQNTGR